MKVKELIKLLQKQDPERLVIMAKDSEGNGYSPFSSIYHGAYLAENTWSGEVGFDKLTPQDIKDGYTEEDLLVGGEPALILCPIN